MALEQHTVRKLPQQPSNSASQVQIHGRSEKHQRNDKVWQVEPQKDPHKEGLCPVTWERKQTDTPVGKTQAY